MYNPLLEAEVRERTWDDLADELHKAIERAARHGDRPATFYFLNVMDLVCTETAAYWRETGLMRCLKAQ